MQEMKINIPCGWKNRKVGRDGRETFLVKVEWEGGSWLLIFLGGRKGC